MRIMAMAGAVAGLIVAQGSAEAARWCGERDGVQSCGFQSYRQCLRAAGPAGDCHRAGSAGGVAAPPVAHAAVPGAYGTGAPGMNRPYWSSPYECYFDDGYGRFTPCSTGGMK